MKSSWSARDLTWAHKQIFWTHQISNKSHFALVRFILNFVSPKFPKTSRGLLFMGTVPFWQHQVQPMDIPTASTAPEQTTTFIWWQVGSIGCTNLSSSLMSKEAPLQVMDYTAQCQHLCGRVTHGIRSEVVTNCTMCLILYTYTFQCLNRSSLCPRFACWGTATTVLAAWVVWRECDLKKCSAFYLRRRHLQNLQQ